MTRWLELPRRPRKIGGGVSSHCIQGHRIIIEYSSVSDKRELLAGMDSDARAGYLDMNHETFMHMYRDQFGSKEMIIDDKPIDPASLSVSMEMAG